MTRSAGPPSIRFGGFRFDERSGELSRLASDGTSQQSARLPPQPAKLLAHLIRRRPEVVTGDEIRQLLWPDVQVEFEQSLHTCVRQIRAALGESATEPRFIETVPRRGYRFLGTVEPDPVPTAGVSAAGRRRGLVLVAWGLGLALLVLAAFRFAPARAPEPARAKKTRIAVLPVAPLGEEELPPAAGDLAESIVAACVDRLPTSVGVVGPTTTQSYVDRPDRLRQLGDDLEIDLIVNARPTRGDSGRRFLIEIIRARDGAHLWARYLDEFPLDRPPSETVALTVEEILKEP